MSVLETIRKRSKLLVILIGLALFTFVLEDLISSGRFFTGGNNEVVATVNGKKIKNQDYRRAADQAVAKKKAFYGVESLKDSVINATEDEALQDMVFHLVVDPECKKLGVDVSDSELHDLMLGSHPANDIYEFFSDHRGHITREFADSRGGLNMNAVVGFLQKADEQQQMQWASLEERIKLKDLKIKYFYLLIQGMFATDAMAKQVTDDASKTYDISYNLKRYTDVPDNSVTVTDQDITDYYNKHLYEYNQQDESRRLDYVVFSSNPTSKDLDSLRREVDSIEVQFKTNKKIADDSTTIANSDAGFMDNTYHSASELPGSIDSIMTNSEVGEVYGPYKEDGKYKIAKLLDVASLPDSVKISAIIIQAPNGDYDKVKSLADSVKDSANADNFAELAQKYSADPSTKDKGGDLGWYYRKEPTLQPEIQHAAFFGNKGDITELKIQGGYIILYIADASEKTKCYKVGIAYKNILPSAATKDSVYKVASEFAGKNSSSADFEKAAGQMNRRVVDIGENDRDIGLENSRAVIRFAYEKKEGDVSEPVNEGETEYLVLHLLQITPKGTIPLAQIKDEVKSKATQEKKAEKLITEMNTGGNTHFTSTAKGLTFNSYSIPGLGKEDAVIGTMSALNTGATSKPIQGELGVYVIHIDSTYYADKPDYRLTQQQLTQEFRRRVETESYDALLKNAGYENHVGKFR